MKSPTIESAPLVEPRGWVRIGNTPAVVTAVNVADTDAIEVVYADRGKAVHEFAVWEDDEWRFLGPGGGHADEDRRFGEFVTILRSSRG